jgi:hypothetical protein
MLGCVLYPLFELFIIDYPEFEHLFIPHLQYKYPAIPKTKINSNIISEILTHEQLF